MKVRMVKRQQTKQATAQEPVQKPGRSLVTWIGRRPGESSASVSGALPAAMLWSGTPLVAGRAARDRGVVDVPGVDVEPHVAELGGDEGLDGPSSPSVLTIATRRFTGWHAHWRTVRSSA